VAITFISGIAVYDLSNHLPFLQ